jgi:hypothetical protein
LSAQEVTLPSTTQNPHFYELAKRGAEVQLRELVHEVKLLIGLFPHLRDSFDKDELPISFIVAKDSGALTKKGAGRRPRARMSAVARKAVSERMKKYWAARRKTEKE